MLNKGKLMEEFGRKMLIVGDIERQVSKILNSAQFSRLNPNSFENFSHIRLKEAYALV
jgi:hypothetical protein